MFSDKHGMTLIEVIVTLFILALVIGGAFAVYLSNMRIYKSETKTAEAQISKFMALELLRRDIIHAGYGLPWDVGGINYEEAIAAEAALYNDAPNGTPRAFVLGDNATNGGDYFVIKSVKAQENSASRKWAYFSYDGIHPPQWDFLGEEGEFEEWDRTIFLKAVPPDERQLFVNDDQWSWTGKNYSPDITQDTLFFVYGLDNVTLRMPFNRVDYYLDKSGLPEGCCPTTYVLKRATINHADGKRNAQPVLDCVRDFQVSFGLDTDDDGSIDTWNSTLTDNATVIRDQVKEVRVFILQQEGQLLDHEASEVTITLGDNDTGTLSSFTPSDGGHPGECVKENEKCYRWKVLKLTVRPMNLGE